YALVKEERSRTKKLVEGRFIEVVRPPRRTQDDRLPVETFLSDAGEVIAAVPMWGKGAEDLLQLVLGFGAFRKGEGFFAGEIEEFAVAQRIGDVKSQIAGLACAEKFTRTAELQIGFGDFESVRSAYHGFEARAGVVRHVPGSDKDQM